MHRRVEPSILRNLVLWPAQHHVAKLDWAQTASAFWMWPSRAGLAFSSQLELLPEADSKMCHIIRIITYISINFQQLFCTRLPQKNPKATHWFGLWSNQVTAQAKAVQVSASQSGIVNAQAAIPTHRAPPIFNQQDGQIWLLGILQVITVEEFLLPGFNYWARLWEVPRQYTVYIHTFPSSTKNKGTK